MNERQRIKATYLIETPYSPEKAVEVLAGEQSSGTFTSIPGETPEVKERFAARVEHIEMLESQSSPALPGEHPGSGQYHRARVTVSWPLDNFLFNIPTLISTLQGNLYELKQFTGLKLDDFDLPPVFAERFPGPAFGTEGTKELAAVPAERPMIGTIIKPSVGLNPGNTAELVRELAEAGIDFVKDDELMASTANSPFDDRVRAVMHEILELEQKTGRKVMYAFNISGDLDTMKRNYDRVEKAGGSCVMISLNSVGWVGVNQMTRHGRLSVHGHRNGWGMLNRHPLLGINFPAYSKLWRLAGVDQLHVNGIRNKFWESDESVVRSIKSCLSPFLGQRLILPVVSSGQWGGQAFETYRLTKTTDLLYLAGGGILAHPSGPPGGVRAIRQAWQGAVEGWTSGETAEKFREYRQSVEKFGKKG